MAKRYLSLTLAFLVSPLVAQGGAATPLDEASAALNKSATKVLLKFAGFAKSKKFGPMEKTGCELVISDYDPNNKRARRSLDYKKDKKGEWNLLPPLKRKEWRDQANRKGRFAVQQEWRKTCMALAKEHRELGLQMIESDGEYLAKGAKHLRQAILYNPMDQVSHEALGHVSYENNGVTYFGTEVEVAFMKRMKEIETFALELAKKDYNPKPVDEIPEELSRLGLEIYGAKTDNFTVFVRGTQENAFDVVQWGERALDFLDYMAGPKHKNAGKIARANMKSWGYLGFLWTSLEKDEFIKLNPELISNKKRFGGNLIYRKNGRIMEISTISMPARMHDKMIAHTWQYALQGANHGLLEGVHHAATWFLKSTCATRYGAEPKGTQTGRKLILPEGAAWWLREMRNQSIARSDVPINVVPRTELAKFHPDIRLKTWSWHVWAFARFPDQWLNFLLGAPADKIPFPEEIDKLGLKAFGIPLKEAEEQWRDWASGRGVTAAATGYGPPLLPEFPNDDELDALDHLNSVRRAASTFALPGGEKKEEKGGKKKKKGRTSGKSAKSGGQWAHLMPECELDSEATAACKDHAKFLGMHESHQTWPEAHEENPALEGFSPRGMRAAARSVIIWTTGQMNSKRAIDGWIGTVYHRFPLLEYNIKRFGMAFDDSSDLEIMVLDMGSLEEPRTDALERACGFVAWPPHGMKNVPRQFSFEELPNPLEDVGIEPGGQKNTGYPVSLQFTRLVMANSTNVTMKLYEAKKRGKTYENGDEIPCWLHTPDEPLLKRMVMRNVVFVIPKAVLPGNESYKAVVSMTVGGAPRKYEWVFTTGNQLQGLGKLR